MWRKKQEDASREEWNANRTLTEQTPAKTSDTKKINNSKQLVLSSLEWKFRFQVAFWVLQFGSLLWHASFSNKEFSPSDGWTIFFDAAVDDFVEQQARWLQKNC